MKKYYSLVFLLGSMLGTTKAQSPVKLSRDTATAYRIAASGSTVIWFDRKSGTDYVYASFNKQKALTSNRSTIQGLDGLVAGERFAAFLDNNKIYATTDGITFENALVDTSLANPFSSVEMNEDKLFAIQPAVNANFALYEKASVSGPGVLLTSKARMYAHSKGYLSWWQLDDTIAFRKPGGEMRYITQVEDVREIKANGNQVAWIKDGAPFTVQYAVDGENQRMVTSLKSNNSKMYFLAADKMVIADDSLYVYQLGQTISRIRQYPLLPVIESKNSGLILVNGSSVPYTLTSEGDTFNISTVPGYNSFTLMGVSGENLCVVTRPSSFVSVMKWYKNGVFQKDIVPATENVIINEKGFSVSDLSVAWAQAGGFTGGDRAKGGIYLYEFSPVSGLRTEAGNRVEVSVYPNPASQVLHIDAPGIRQVEIVTIQGAVMSSGLYTGEVDVAALKPGIYFIRIATEKGETGVCKFVKQ